MSEQNFKNHSRLLPVWHFIVPLIIGFLLAVSIILYNRSTGEASLTPISLFMITLVLILLFWYARKFALVAQDRAIRAEENFRHYILTGKPHDPRLRIRQIIALRFASDAEMPALAKNAVEQNLTSTQIKKAIQNWKGDYYRV